MKLLLAAFTFVAITLNSYGQTQKTKFNYDIKKTRLLIAASGMYLQSANQGLIDTDSAMVLACNAENLPVSLSYDEGYNDGAPMPAANFFATRNIEDAKALLPNLTAGDKMKLLLELAGYYLFKPGNEKSDLDNAFIFIQNARQLSDSIKILKWQNQSWIILGKYYNQAGDFKNSNACFLHVVNESQKSADEKAIAEALENQGTFLSRDDTSKVNVLTRAKDLYEKLGFREKAIELLMKILNVHFWNGQMSLVKQELYQILALEKSIDFKHTQYAETTISFVELREGNPDKALYYAQQSIKTMESLADTALADYFYIRLGSVYNELGRYEDAIELYKKSLNGKKQNKIISYRVILSSLETFSGMGKDKEALDYLQTFIKSAPPSNTFDSMIIAHFKAMCYEKLNKIETAEIFYKQTALLAGHLHFPETLPNVAESYTSVALFYANIGQVDNAKLYINKVPQTDLIKNDVYIQKDIQLVLFKIDSLLGKYLPAIQHYEEFKNLDDSIYNISKNRQIEELQIQYETSKKEQNIILLEKESKLQQSELKRANLVRNLILGGVFLLIAVIGLLYNRYHLKQRINQQLQALVEEKEGLIEDKDWLVKEIHHRVKNNLQIVISLMNIQARHLESGEALHAIRESQSRMNTMSLIHQKLYQSPSLVSIDMFTYINELVNYLIKSFGRDKKIDAVIDIANVELDVSQVVPIGLILNEAITNSMKYAFTEKKDNKLSISLQPAEKDSWILFIADNGAGLPANFNYKNSASIGMTLMETLTEQIGGSFNLKNNEGLEITIKFVKDKRMKTRIKPNLS